MSRHSLIGLGLVASLATLSSNVALGFVAPQQKSFSPAAAKMLLKGEKVIRPNLTKQTVKSFGNRFDQSVNIEVDAVSGAVRLITGELAPAPRAMSAMNVSDLIDVATNWIASHEDVLKVQVDDVAVIDDATLMTPDTQFISFSVSRHGTPIADASLHFRFKFGKLVQVQATTFGEAQDDARAGFVSATDAVERIDSAATVQEQGQVLRAEATAKGYRLVRVNKALVSVGGQVLNVQTDAATGEIYESKDTKFYADGVAHGLIFPRTYYQSQAIDAKMMEMDVTTEGGSTRTALDGKFLFNGTVAPKITALAGQRVTIRPSTGTAISRTAAQKDGVWDLNLDVTGEKDQAQVHTYAHLNMIIQKAKKYISAPWMDRNLRANVNLGETCNAYWDGSTVNFFSAGGGCGNTGLISDVMYHEWGHGLDANTGGISDGAYSEGFGDILSMIMTNDSKLGPGFRRTGGIVRDMEPDKVYPKDRGEVHAEGLIIGGTFWDLFKGLTAKYNADQANEIVSNIAFKTVMTASKYTDVYNAALVVNDNDGNTTTPAPDFCEINAAFSAHGLATKSADCP